MNSPAVEHVPVLAETLTEQIRLPQDGVMVDATIGQGGHSLLFGAKLGPEAVLVGLDVDKKSLRRAQSSLEHLRCRVICIHANFADITQALHDHGINKADFILADLGLSSSQLADPGFGLSFNTDMPLDMRFDERLTTTAADIVNEADEKSLAELIYKFGQDRASRRIARFIVTQRRKKTITTTGELAAIVTRALTRPGKKTKGRIHPATRTFQALRIAVNNELESLEKLLDSAPAILKKDGYIAVISFHSLEDRLVKNNFRQNEKDDLYKILTKKPLVPTRDEIAANRRARSAKLRIAQRI